MKPLDAKSAVLLDELLAELHRHQSEDRASDTVAGSSTDAGLLQDEAAAIQRLSLEVHTGKTTVSRPRDHEDATLVTTAVPRSQCELQQNESPPAQDPESVKRRRVAGVYAPSAGVF